jgi:hypothetical protein
MLFQSPFIRRLRHVAPRLRGNPDKPRNAKERLAMRRGARCKPVSFYDSRMGGALHVLASRLRYYVASQDRAKPDVIAHETKAAEVAACRLSRRAWHARCGLRLTRTAAVWARRRAGWRAGPAMIPHDMREAFPRYLRFYLRTMRADVRG